MMKLSLPVARQVSQLMEGIKLPASQCTSKPIEKMLEDGVLQKQMQGRSKAYILAPNANVIPVYLANNFGISDLDAYIRGLDSVYLARADAIEISGNSKLKNVRTFKGFLINSYQPLSGTLNNEPFNINPAQGSFNFIYDFDEFNLPENVTIVGVENPENFRWIHKQAYLFPNITPLFVSRYPQSKDLVRWLKRIPNSYLHFGDLDFASISIFQSEINCHIQERAGLFIPQQLDRLLDKYGNRELYFKQASHFADAFEKSPFQEVIALFHKYQKVLEQEIFIKVRP